MHYCSEDKVCFSNVQSTTVCLEYNCSCCTDFFATCTTTFLITTKIFHLKKVYSYAEWQTIVKLDAWCHMKLTLCLEVQLWANYMNKNNKNKENLVTRWKDTCNDYYLACEHGMTLVYNCGTGLLFCKTCPKLLLFSMLKLVSNSYQGFSQVCTLVSCLLHQMLPCLTNLVQISIFRQRSQLFFFLPFPEKSWNTPLDTDYLNNAKAANGNWIV